MKYFFNDSAGTRVEQAYLAVPPMPDNEELMKRGRLILYHDIVKGPRVFWALPGEMVAGWVIGVEPR